MSNMPDREVEVGACPLKIRSRNHFSGRIIFDHLPKTAGQAINAWLRSSLGDACVTDNLIGKHRELINTYGGSHGVISAHVEFISAEGLDPRYQYVTLFRDPLDRVISWIFFVLKNHDAASLPIIYQQAEKFLETEGRVLGEELRGNIANLYTHHFSRILGAGDEDDETRIYNAIQAVQLYDIVGTYEDLPLFIEDLGALIGIPAPERLNPVNVTVSRPQVHQLSEKLRDRIVELNHLDLRLYATVRDILKGSDHQKAPAHSSWLPLPVRKPRIFTSSDFTVHHIEMLTPDHIEENGIISFALDIELRRGFSNLEAGIHIFDLQQRWAFGVNSKMLGKAYRDMKPGRYRLVHHVVARLPLGQYTAGFAFADGAAEYSRDLFWQDAEFAFTVVSNARYPGVGYSVCPAQQALWPMPKQRPTSAQIS
jgi:hypothetical protein